MNTSIHKTHNQGQTTAIQDEKQSDSSTQNSSATTRQCSTAEGLTYPLPPEAITLIHEDIIEAIRTVYDPEIPVNIYDLGLIYNINLDPNGFVSIKMTLTAAACPFAQTLPGLVEDAVNMVKGVVETTVELVWDPPWSQEQMSEAARLSLGLL